MYYFEVELDDEPGAHYAMRNDSVLLYADEEQLSFARFCLPLCCPANPDDKIAQVRVPKKIGRMVDDDYTDKEDGAEEEEEERGEVKIVDVKETHKSKRTTNTSIIHDSVMLSGKRDTDFEGDADGEDLNDDIDLFKEKRYAKT